MALAALAALLLVADAAVTAANNANTSTQVAASTGVPTRGSRSSAGKRWALELNSGSVRVKLPNDAVGDELMLNAGDPLLVPCEGRGPLRWWSPGAAADSHATAIVNASNNHPYADDTHRPLEYNQVNGNHAGLYCCSRDSGGDNPEGITLYHTDTQKCVYLFVNDPTTPIVEASKRKTITAVQGESVTLPCRPSSCNVDLQLNAVGNSKPDKTWNFYCRKGFIKKIDVVITGHLFRCKTTTADKPQKIFILTVKAAPRYVDRPQLHAPLLLREGADLHFTCAIITLSTVDVSFNFSLQGITSKEPLNVSPMNVTAVNDNKTERMMKQQVRARGVFAPSGGGASQVCCDVHDHIGNKNSTCRAVSVTRRGSHPEMRFALVSQPPDGDDEGRDVADVFVKMKRGPVFYWYALLAWQEEKVLPVASWMNPDGEKKEVGDPKRTGDWAGVSVTWRTPLQKVKASAPGIALHNMLEVKVPTRSAEPGNYTLEVSVGKAKQSLQVEWVQEGPPHPRLLNASLSVVGSGVARIVCVARADPHPDSIRWEWVRCNGTAAQPCDDKGPGGPGVDPVTDKEATWDQRPGGRGTLLSALTLRNPVAGRWLRCQAGNAIGEGHTRALPLQVALAAGARGPSPGLVGGVVGVVALICGAAGACVYITLRQKRERRRLHCAGLQGLVAGEPGALDPALPADEQAELLPYQARWEFPREDLTLGKQLGAGAFGVVMKGEARGIMEEEEVTTVAVKMLKRGADDAYLRALASELKILVHLGRHLNVVNLLGACTERIMERELLVIVEYCPYGNLHNYLLRHREGFVDQLDPLTGRVDGARGAAQLAAAEVASRRARLLLGSNLDSTPGSTESGTAVTYCPAGDSYTGGSGYDSGGSSVPLSPLPMDDSSSSGGPQPLWRTLYRCDTRAPARVLCTSDLLSWTFQVASGMKYLAQRKVLHGDLAARNVLLAKDGIVKICDFGLARSMYKSDTYKKKGDGPLPIKWMALESIRDRIFSTQSDVWSFGVVMWELFSLGATPYPGMQPSEEFYNKLLSGYRMECPQYAPLAIYDLMCACWETDPRRRLTFEKLASELGLLLDSSTRERFETLIAYEQQRGEVGGECDYLAMLGSPDYGALTSPDEHVYVNSRPTTAGSQQMGPESNINPDPEPINDYLNMSRPNTPGSQVSFF